MKRFLKNLAKYLSFALISSILTSVLLFGLFLIVSTQYRMQYIRITFENYSNENITPTLEVITPEGLKQDYNINFIDNSEPEKTSFIYFFNLKDFNELKIKFDKINFPKLFFSNAQINGHKLLKKKSDYSLGILKLSQNLEFDNNEEQNNENIAITYKKNYHDIQEYAYIKTKYNVEKNSQANTSFSLIYFVLNNYLSFLITVFLIATIIIFAVITYGVKIINRECSEYTYNENLYFK